jgi:glycerate-2-kinase
MAEGASSVLGDRIRAGSLCTAEGHARAVHGLRVREAAHPIPDSRSARSASEALELAGSLGPDDTLLVLISGGASALWAAPPEGVDLDAKRGLTDLLLRGGVDIDGINTVRKHVSRIKGGGLLRSARRARVLTLAVSDVRADREEVIGSGPTAPDPTTYDDALEVLRRASLLDEVPPQVRGHLEAGAAGRRPETLKPGDPALERSEIRVVARLEDALRAAAAEGERRGLRVLSLGACLYGEAREVARDLADRVEKARAEGSDLVVAGGEPTVRVRGSGKGGRAQELALAFALAIRGRPFVALFAASDGTDGPTDAAGAAVDGSTASRALARGLDPLAHLERNDAYPLLAAAGDLIRTGPTDTNVTDLALVRILRPG